MEEIKHECGIAMIRLLKPVEYYKEKYGTQFYGLNKLYLLMEKEHNRGQEGAGAGCVRMNAAPGEEYIFRERAEGNNAIERVFANIYGRMEAERDSGDATPPFVGDVYMGHLRYSTTGRAGLSYVHPFLRRNNWSARNLLLCGNFNLTNVREILDNLTRTGQHPRLNADTFLLLEQLGHALDRENERLYNIHRQNGEKGLVLAESIARELNTANVLARCAPLWDGGYVICGIVGNGDMWAMRDPHGIRPAFYYADDEVVVVASERPVIQTVMDVPIEQVKELTPGSAIIVDRDGSWREQVILPEKTNARCSFERIYFSRGSDRDIYRERKELGRRLVRQVSAAVDEDIDNTVFSFIPNTAEVAFFGLVEGFEQKLLKSKITALEALGRNGNISDEAIERIIGRTIHREKIAIKDIKLRTFIAESGTRNDLAAHVYDVTYGTVTPGKDNLVVIDDSIVRGTTLRQSIIHILDRLGPKRIVIVSSSPQVRYPDCYGIDMSRMGEFIAFRAAVSLLKEQGMDNVLDNTYRLCKRAEENGTSHLENFVRKIYEPFTDEDISRRIAAMLTPPGTKAEVKIVYQTLENMHKAIPGHPGDWYFSGKYPTPGGNRLVNRAFINFYEGKTLSRD